MRSPLWTSVKIVKIGTGECNENKSVRACRARLRSLGSDKTRSAEVFWQSECELLKSTEVRQTINWAMQTLCKGGNLLKSSAKTSRVLFKVSSRALFPLH